MKKILITSAVIALTAASASALADGVPQSSSAYVTIGAGVGALNTPNETLQNETGSYTESRDKGSVAGRVALGYVAPVASQLKIGAELGYNYNGRNKYDFNNGSTDYNLKYTQTSADLLAVLLYQMTQSFSLNAKAGEAYVMQQVKANSAYASTVTGSIKNKNKFLPEVAIGGAYNLTPSVALGLEGAHTFGKKIDHVNAQANTITGSDLSQVASGSTIMATLSYSF